MEKIIEQCLEINPKEGIRKIQRRWKRDNKKGGTKERYPVWVVKGKQISTEVDKSGRLYPKKDIEITDTNLQVALEKLLEMLKK